jgi:hypothetical protein
LPCPFCTRHNKYIKKRFVKIGLKIKKLRFWAVAPFDPLYLENGVKGAKNGTFPGRVDFNFSSDFDEIFFIGFLFTSVNGFDVAITFSKI